MDVTKKTLCTLTYGQSTNCERKYGRQGGGDISNRNGKSGERKIHLSKEEKGERRKERKGENKEKWRQEKRRMKKNEDAKIMRD